MRSNRISKSSVQFTTTAEELDRVHLFLPLSKSHSRISVRSGALSNRGGERSEAAISNGAILSEKSEMAHDTLEDEHSSSKLYR